MKKFRLFRKAGKVPAAKKLLVPPIVWETTKWLEENALEEVGLFRISASKTDLDALMKTYKKGRSLKLKSESDPHLIAAFLKMFIRECVHDSLLIGDLAPCWISAISQLNDERKRNGLQTVAGLMPAANRSLATHLFKFLNKVSQHASVNKMNAHNLAIVFGPNLFPVGAYGLNQSVVVIKLTKYCIENPSLVFETESKELQELTRLSQSFSTQLAQASLRLWQRQVKQKDEYDGLIDDEFKPHKATEAHSMMSFGSASQVCAAEESRSMMYGASLGVARGVVLRGQAARGSRRGVSKSVAPLPMLDEQTDVGNDNGNVKEEEQVPQYQRLPEELFISNDKVSSHYDQLDESARNGDIKIDCNSRLTSNINDTPAHTSNRNSASRKKPSSAIYVSASSRDSEFRSNRLVQSQDYSNDSEEITSDVMLSPRAASRRMQMKLSSSVDTKASVSARHTTIVQERAAANMSPRSAARAAALSAPPDLQTSPRRTSNDAGASLVGSKSTQRLLRQLSPRGSGIVFPTAPKANPPPLLSPKNNNNDDDRPPPPVPRPRQLSERISLSKNDSATPVLIKRPSGTLRLVDGNDNDGVGPMKNTPPTPRRDLNQQSSTTSHSTTNQNTDTPVGSFISATLPRRMPSQPKQTSVPLDNSSMDLESAQWAGVTKALSFTAEELCELVVDGLQPRFVAMYVRAADPALAPRVAELVAQRLAATPPPVVDDAEELEELETIDSQLFEEISSDDDDDDDDDPIFETEETLDDE